MNDDLVGMTHALIDAMAASDLTEAEWQKGEYRLRLSRGGGAVPVEIPVSTPAPVPVAKTATTAGTEVRAPMHGIFYAASEPKAAPLVDVGTVVAAADPLCVIEAMKTFTVIPAPIAGRVEAILCQSGQEVTPDTVLFRLVPV